MIHVRATSANALAGSRAAAAKRARCQPPAVSSRHTPCAVAEPPSRITGANPFRSAPRASNAKSASATAHGVCLLRSRRGFTLVELLITISIIGIMATMVLFAMFQAQQTANVHKTRALITKLNSIIMRRYDEYKTRRVPYIFPAVLPGNSAADQKQAANEIARARLDCLRDIMRMEMPDRWSDVTDDPVAPFNHGIGTSILPQYVNKIARPALNQAYRTKYTNLGTATIENQGAECLYMIVMGAIAQEGDSRDFFKADDIADVDNDGFPEFVDAWNQPIEFIRWAPGYLSDLQSPIRLSGNVSQDASTQTATVNVTANHGPRLSQTPGSYVGGAIAFLHEGKEQIDSTNMGRITGYRYNYDDVTKTTTVTFTCSTPNYTDQLPFSGNSPDGEFVVLQPDAFDSRGAYPLYAVGSATAPNPDTSIPTYMIYPLIISKGPDRAMGVKDGQGGGTALQYSTVRLNPFYVATPSNEAYGLMLGSIPKATDGEPQWYEGCHRDNITNHQLTTR